MLGIYKTKYEFDTLLLPTDTKVFDLKYHNCCVETRNDKAHFYVFYRNSSLWDTTRLLCSVGTEYLKLRHL